MDKETKQELREIVQSCSSSILTKVEAQNEIINTKLDGINTHLARINGKVASHEKTINDAMIWRAKKYTQVDEKFEEFDEIIPKVRALEDTQLTTKAIKRWIIGTIAITGTLIGIISFIIKFVTES